MESIKNNIPYGHQTIDSDDINAVARVLRSDWITQGSKIEEFEDALCGYTGARYAVAVSSGTAALHIACLAGGIKKGDEAVTSPITFIASANCILYCGGRPAFADILEGTANINPEEIEKRINRKTKAVIPVHFAGHPADLAEIRRIAERRNLIVIEDAAHALGSIYKGSKVGSCKYSDMTIFSFHPVKTITTGEGGAVLTNRKDLYNKLLMMRNHGITKKSSQLTAHSSQLKEPWYYEQQYLGFNYRITDFQSVLGISQMGKLSKFIKKRREIARIYNKALSKTDQIELPVEGNGIKAAWHLYVIRLKDQREVNTKRRNIFNHLRKHRIGAQVHYIPAYLHPYYRGLGYRKGLCPEAERFYRRAISLPLYPGIKDSELKYIINTLKDGLRKYA